MRKLLLTFLVFTVAALGSVDARKVRHSLRIDKEKTSKTPVETVTPEGRQINLTDTMVNGDGNTELRTELRKINFAGYDKEPNSNKESFLLVNPTQKTVKGYKVRIDYLDMQGRMLHSQEITRQCMVPPGETRRFDIRSWDTQHTYYYYLGNEPKKVATPFQVIFTPLVLWIED